MAGLILKASGAETATANGSDSEMAQVGQSPIAGLVGLLDITAASAVVGDTLDVKIQTSWDDGTTFHDLIAFPQWTGDLAGTQFAMTIKKAVTEAARIQSTVTLAVNNVSNFFGPLWRARWIIAGTGSFTFSVNLIPF